MNRYNISNYIEIAEPRVSDGATELSVDHIKHVEIVIVLP